MSVLIPGARDTITIGSSGGTVFTNVKTRVLCLFGYGASSADTWATLRNLDSTSGYTPSGSKAFKWLALRIHASESTGDFDGSWGYGNNDVGLSAASGSGPTSPVYMAGVGGTNPNTNFRGTAKQFYDFSVAFTVPNGKYPFMRGGGTSIQLKTWAWGYEY